MSTSTPSVSRFQVGDWVTFPLGARNARAKIVEDRGPLTRDGRTLYRVRMYHDAGSANSRPVSSETEIPESNLEAAVLDPREVMEYLVKGGLVKILRRNNGDSDDLRVWLTFNGHGEVAATLHEERGLMGGVAIPCRALDGARIFEPAKDDVIQFLTNFGLDVAQAQHVVNSVGVAGTT